MGAGDSADRPAMENMVKRPDSPQVRFTSAAGLEQTLKDYLLAYNHFILQRAIGHRSPIDALKS
jgi:hypothetical protein